MPRLLLIASDDPELVESLEGCLEGTGCRTRTASDRDQTRAALRVERPELLLLDAGIEGGCGLDLFSELRGDGAPPTVVLLRAAHDLASAVRAARLGAVDVLAAPVSGSRVRELLRLSAGEAAGAAERQPPDPWLECIVGDSGPVRRLREHIRRVAAAPRSTVLIQGESGVGKELAARAVHGLSGRASHPFVALNCASLSETLFEAELFGYAPGAFTGGRAGGHAGLVCAAEGGTLFLDEVAELSIASQAKLLRFLQERRYRRVGETRDRATDARVIAATNRDLPQEVDAGRFREDLFYRLNVLSIHVPPLRERMADVVPIASGRLQAIGAEIGTIFQGFTDAALGRLEAHAWPGNVRELFNVVERAAVLALDEVGAGCIDVEHLQLQSSPSRRAKGPSGEPAHRLDLESWCLRDAEVLLIRRVIESCGGNRSRAARELGIHRTTLYEKMRRYGLMPRDAS